jgi:hypothetical protein
MAYGEGRTEDWGDGQWQEAGRLATDGRGDGGKREGRGWRRKAKGRPGAGRGEGEGERERVTSGRGEGKAIDGPLETKSPAGVNPRGANNRVGNLATVPSYRRKENGEEAKET